MQFISTQIGYARSHSFTDKIYKTTDGGLNWSSVYEVSEDIRAFHFINESVGYLVGDDALAYKTIDGGATWQKMTNIPYGYFVEVRFFSKTIGYVADDYGKLYKTTNGGNTWQQSTESYQIKDIAIVNDDVYLGGTFGKILKRSLGLTQTNEPDYSVSKYLIFPNPATGDVQIAAKENQHITSVRLMDISGRQVLKSDHPVDPAHLSLNVSNLPRGVYFVEICGENSIEQAKLIVQ
jgi:hypothetical protein